MSAAHLDHALAYAALGWPVFPLAPGTKIPLRGSRGVHDATTDPETIRAWWSEHQSANIGAAAGGAWWVLDIDRTADADGAETVAVLQERHERLPVTLMQRTGGGGWQAFFAADRRVTNSVKRLPGIDTRAAGGYVVLPPSVHPSGRRYRWVRDTGIAPAPAWLVEALSPPTNRPHDAPASAGVAIANRYIAAALDKACRAIASAPIGRQSVTLGAQSYGIGRILHLGLGMEEAARLLTDAGMRMTNAPGRRPWTLGEVAHQVERCLRQGAAMPRKVEAAA